MAGVYMKQAEKRSNRSEGSRGEVFARNYLLQQGWTILQAPYECTVGEIDIIALDGDALVFVEIKTRTSRAYGDPVLAVTRNKQKRMIKTARHYLAHAQPTGFIFCRFDVMGLTPIDHSADYNVNHLRDAFRLQAEDMAFSY
jgi:putative endonuclease